MSDKPRKSLQQLTAEAEETDGADPWACPRCGCKDWRVVGTYERNGKRRRQRVCRNCKQTMRTYEVPVPVGCDVVVIASGVSGKGSVSVDGSQANATNR